MVGLARVVEMWTCAGQKWVTECPRGAVGVGVAHGCGWHCEVGGNSPNGMYSCLLCRMQLMVCRSGSSPGWAGW